MGQERRRLDTCGKPNPGNRAAQWCHRRPTRNWQACRLLNAAQKQDNWIHHHRDYTAQRYSPLNQINRNNVNGLHVAWTMALGGIEGGGIWSHGGLEGTPIVENGFMYVTDGWGSVYKIDMRGGTGKLVWRMDPKTDHDWAGAVACCVPRSPRQRNGNRPQRLRKKSVPPP